MSYHPSISPDTLWVPISRHFHLFCMPNTWLIVNSQWKLNGPSPKNTDMSLYPSESLWCRWKLNEVWRRRKTQITMNLKAEATVNSIQIISDSRVASIVIARSSYCPINMYMCLNFQVFASFLLSPGMWNALPSSISIHIQLTLNCNLILVR